MQLAVRRATPQDIDGVAGLYDDVIDHLEATANYPGWQKGVYPTRRDGEAGIADGCLFVAETSGRIAGSMVLRREMEPAYHTVSWQRPLEENQVLVIHTLAVSPHMPKSGVGKALLAFAEQYAQEQGVRALRLDVVETNTPAIGLYERCGYRHIDTISLGLEEYGLDWFKLYEKLLP